MSADRAELEHPFRDLFARTSRLLYEVNPIGIYGGPDDEYDPEVGTILPRLEGAESAQDVQVVVYEEFCSWFSEENAGEYSDYAAVSEGIWVLWREYQIALEAHKTLVRVRNNAI